MAKYTLNDKDILKLNNNEKEDYNSFLMKYDLDKYQKINQGINLLINYKNINLLNVEHIIQLLFLIPIVIILILVIINIFISVVQYKLNYFSYNPTHNKYLLGSCLLIIFLLFLLFVFNYIYELLKTIIKSIYTKEYTV